LAFDAPAALFLQPDDIWEMVRTSGPGGLSVLVVLLCFSVYSWTIVFSKWGALRTARSANQRFLRAFRKAGTLQAVTMACEQYRPAPLVTVFDFGYEEVERQVKKSSALTNRPAVERALQLGVSQELAKLERHMDKLATTASVTPFIGLLGTVLGIVSTFVALGSQGATSIKTLGPGIAEALITTAAGLFAAIPAAIFYNHFGHQIRELVARMDDFAMEFLNMAERGFGE